MVSQSVSEIGSVESHRRTEGGLDDRDLGCGGVDTGEGAPIVDDESGSENVRSSVDGTGLRARRGTRIRLGVSRVLMRMVRLTYDQGDLEQTAQLLLL